MDVAGLMIVAAITRVFVEQCEGRRCILCDWLLLYPFLTDFRENNCQRNYFQIVIRAAWVSANKERGRANNDATTMRFSWSLRECLRRAAALWVRG